MRRESHLRTLARSLLAGEPTVAQTVARARLTLGRPWRWLRPLAKRYLKTFAGRTRPRQREVVRFLRMDPALARAWPKLSVAQLAEPQHMQPVAAAAHWDVPRIESVGDLASWLNLTAGELDWFADLKGQGYKSAHPKLKHYFYRVLTKGSGDFRLIEAPKSRLKEIQRRILAEILEKIPAHPAVHGFHKGRSIKTFVAPHVGQHVILRMDLEDFFPTFSGVRIQTLFRTAGYPEAVADLLGGICTNAVPRDAWNGQAASWDTRALYARPHLPQGAPTSPAIANICFYRADCRLAGLARSAGARYTRYADDVAFSGSEDFERCAERFSRHVAAILHEEGFRVHHRKTRLMRQGVRQHLAGLVANQGINVIRTDFDRLKAILSNCARLAPETQNRAAHPNFRLHLEGRVAFVESINPVKGKRLRRIFDQIRW